MISEGGEHDLHFIFKWNILKFNVKLKYLGQVVCFYDKN